MLLYAKFLTKRPPQIPEAKRLTGRKAQGTAYEKKVIRELQRRDIGEVHYHKWIEYYDAKIKTGYCEPEAFIVYPTRILLLECKLTGVPEGRSQMEELYAPLLYRIFNPAGTPPEKVKKIQMLQICKYVTKDTPGPFVQSVEEFLTTTESYGTWHYLG